MRRAVAVLVALSVLWIPAAQAGPSAGGNSSDNVEFIANVPFAAGYAEGGRRVGDYFYVTVNGQGLLIFDVSDPQAPALTGRLQAPHFWENEDIATNGKIALISQLSYPFAYMGDEAKTQLSIVDVEDKASPKVIATLPGGGDHTYECLYRCKFAYGSVTGRVFDLRDPAKPKVLEERWTQALPQGTFVHDVTEVRPGFVLTASDPMFYLDIRQDITKPKVLAHSTKSVHTGHNVMWPASGKSPIVLTATEAVLATCATRQEGTYDDAAIETWDASKWSKTKTFTSLDQYRVRNGTYTDGEPVVSGYYGCSAHWFEPHPDFNGSGLVAGGFYGHGVKFLSVDRNGAMEEIGHFLGWGANTSAAYWITDDIVYTVDMHRGIDIVRVKP